MAFSDEFGGTLKCAGNEMKIFPAVDIGIVHVNNAVPVQKRGFYRAAESRPEGEAKSHANFFRSSSMYRRVPS